MRIACFSEDYLIHLLKKYTQISIQDVEKVGIPGRDKMTWRSWDSVGETQKLEWHLTRAWNFNSCDLFISGILWKYQFACDLTKRHIQWQVKQKISCFFQKMHGSVYLVHEKYALPSGCKRWLKFQGWEQFIQNLMIYIHILDTSSQTGLQHNCDTFIKRTNLDLDRHYHCRH